jgi:hypothetical protein
MNTRNLIIAGAHAQKHFDMKDGFDVVFIPADNHAQTYRIAVMDNKFYSDLQFDDVLLETFAIKSDFERIRMGYSRLANKLLVKDTP